MVFRLFQAPVIGIRRAIAPGDSEGFGRGGNGGRIVAFREGDCSQHVVSVGLLPRIRAALGSLPDFIQTGFCLCRMAALKLEFRDRDKGRELIIDHVDGARPSQSVVQALIGARKVMHAESGLALHQRGPDDIPLNSLMRSYFPGAFGQCAGFDKVAKPERALSGISNIHTLGLAIAAPYGETPAPTKRDLTHAVVSR